MRLPASLLIVTLLCLASASCSSTAAPADPPAAPPATPTSAPPAAPPAAPSQPATPSAPPSPGGGQVQVNGHAVWPPSGPGCAEYIACCNAARPLQSSIGIACQMQVATTPVDCERSRRSIRAMISQMGATPPPACGT